MYKKKWCLFLFFIVTLLPVTSCGGVSSETVPTQAVLTQTPFPTYTPYPTYTPFPTFTPFVPSVPTIVTIDSLAKSFSIYFPGNYALAERDATLRSGSLVAFDFIQVGEFLKSPDEYSFISQPPYFDQIQLHTVESIQAFIEYCNQTAPHEGESSCFLIDNIDFVGLYRGQQEAYYHRADYEDYSIQKFGQEYYFTRTRRCSAGAICAFREYTTFLRDSKVDVKVVVYVLIDHNDMDRQAVLSDRLFTSFHIELYP
jgi:hypothetical protein